MIDDSGVNWVVQVYISEPPENHKKLYAYSFYFQQSIFVY